MEILFTERMFTSYLHLLSRMYDDEEASNINQFAGCPVAFMGGEELREGEKIEWHLCPYSQYQLTPGSIRRLGTGATAFVLGGITKKGQHLAVKKVQMNLESGEDTDRPLRQLHFLKQWNKEE